MSSAINFDETLEIKRGASTNNNLFCVTIELLTKCNWNCKHCYIPEHTNEGLSKEKVFDILKQLRALGVFEIVLTGGEIFCRNDIIDIIKKARELFFEVSIFTNVSLLNEEIVNKLSKLYLSRVSCTIFSLNEHIHDYITGIKGSLKKSLRNIILLKKYNINIEIKTVLMEVNFNQYKELNIFCKKNRFKYVASPIITYKTNKDDFPKKLRISKEKLKETLLEIDAIGEDKLNKISNNDYVCETIKYSLFIDANGQVYPCNALNIPVGNIINESIRDIWNNSSKLSYIKNIKWKDLKECNDCKKKDYCFRCPGIALLEDGDILSKSLLACNHADIRYKFSMERSEK